MRSVWQVFSGFLIVAASLLLVLGSFALSFAESGNTRMETTDEAGITATESSQSINPATQTPDISSPTSLPATQIPLPVVLPSLTPSVTPSITPTVCPIPTGWISYLVKTGDTLAGVALRYRTTVEKLLAMNCILADGFTLGTRIYVPPLPANTAIPCRPPSDWILYPVQPGDTLYRLSVMFGVTVRQLQDANCMGTSTLLRLGTGIYVPPWAPILPTSTEAPFYTPTPTWTVIVPDPWTGTPTDTLMAP